MQEFLKQAQKNFEIILWTSGLEDYSKNIISMLEEKLAPFKFDHVLFMTDQTASVDNSFFVKNLEILTGLGGRDDQDIIMIDS